MDRIQEIEKRLSEIKAEIEEPDAKLEDLNKETDSLIEERKGLLDAIEKRKGMLNKIANGQGAVEKEFKEERKMTDKVYDISSKEYRNAWLKNVRGLELNDVEKRAFSSASGSAGAAIPTETANEILKKMKQYAPMLNEITLLNVEGNVKFAVEDTVADADKHAENASITAATDKLKEVSLGSYEITKLVQVSKTVATMSIDAFEGWLTDMLAQKVSEKINAYIIAGTGTSEPEGIATAQTWGTTNSVTVAKTGTLSAANVQSLIGLLNGGYDNGAKFLMSKKTLFTDFMPLQDNSKNSIVQVEGHNYYVYGYPVILDDNIATDDAYLGNFKRAVVGNLSEAINIVSGFDIDTNSYKYLGCAMFDCKVAIGEAIVKLTKAAA